ncbi:MAG TPA: class I SAM-dependent methyltransferase [Chloroflexia bacterium]
MAVATPTRQQSHHTLPPTSTPELEERLVEAIEPWLQHMKWRTDFDRWRERRIWQEEHQEANLQDIRAVLGSKVAGTRLLDLGAGMGGLSVALLREFGGAGLEVQATDYNPDYAQIARLRAQRYRLDLPITVAAGEKLPYADGLFDVVLCMDVLEHVQDVDAVLGEIHRVLKPGGVVLTTVPNRRAFRDPHYHLPFINWLPAALAERIIERAGRSKSEGPLQDRQEHSELNTYTWSAFARLAAGKGFRVRDQVRHRILTGEIRQLHGLRRYLLALVRKLGLVGPLYSIYRYGWQGTYQVMLVKPR